MAVRERIMAAATLTCGLCTLLITGLLVRRELVADPGVDKPVKIDRRVWDTLLTGSLRLGPSDAALTIVEFVDFECPACAKFANTVAKLRKAYPNDFAVVFRHFPLDYHKHAMSLAIGAQCAGDQGRFEAFHDTVFASIRTIGSRSLPELGSAIGIPDTSTFGRCISTRDHQWAVVEDRERAVKLGGTGTPTIVIDGKLMRQLVDSTMLDGLIRKARR
jgi:protein-disulfide isomerase